ncbi:LacI family DNA-binding transcriptional regulator [Nocardioides sp. Y6]|uniref:LacI family DNA-binding transcriptional regulator n=1 Tax=Nocardioides malaquae TaxID=2773426 RepID=A0ABR9RPD0_9ACTN|nr:LacI family DNA-binding transcriptional regulator [Nocardioides malaquae]MBE7323428.1 LacI family DNA-binding transcriptional regulator [Nocardioides malaquae]
MTALSDPTASRRPTILDVARHAGTSKSAVSLALRDDPGVSAETRRRILAAAEEIGYRPHVLARAMRERRTMRLGVVLTSLDNPYHTEVVAAVEESAETAGFSVLLGHGNRASGQLAERINAMLDLRLDGIVVVSSWAEPAMVQAASLRAPVVMIGRSLEPVTGIDSVISDDEAGAALAVDHLVAGGHSRIVHVSSSTRPAGLARRRGYEAAMRRHGLAEHVRVLARTPSDSSLGELDDLLAQGYDAAFARNDVEASDVLDHAWDRGLAVPADLAVVGYDDSMLARRGRPRLTSVHQPRAAMGARAVALLIERLDGRTDDRHEVLPPHLVVRGSAPAR